MNRGMAFIFVGLGIAGLIVAYILVTGFDAPTAVESGLQSVRDLVSAPADDAATEAEEEATPDAAAPPAAATQATSPRRAEPASEPDPGTPVPPAAAPAAEPPVETAPAAPPASAPSGRPPLDRAAHFLPGNYSSWTEFGVMVANPIAVRAGGVVSANQQIAGPDGLDRIAASGAAAAPAGDRLMLPSAPFLALIGRVCSASVCSDPFLIGSDTTLCPSALGIEGQLQLLTNNFVHQGGRQTLSSYSTATGGYSFYTEPAAAAACAAGTAARPVRQDAATLAAGEVVRRPEFSLSSGLTFWKPFFLPLGAPLVIRASGRIDATSGRPATGPEGLEIPEAQRWWTGASNPTIASRRGRLYLEAMPYHALIGRLCGANGCGTPFLVGRERLVCPTPPHTDRLELWINRVILAPGMLDNQTPLTFEMFDVQTQRGEYVFEVASAPAGACGG